MDDKSISQSYSADGLCRAQSYQKRARRARIHLQVPWTRWPGAAVRTRIRVVAHFGPQSGSSVQNDQVAQAQGQRQPWRAIDLAISGVYDVNGLMVGNPDHRCSRMLAKRSSVQDGRFDVIKSKFFSVDCCGTLCREPESNSLAATFKFRLHRVN